jgi:tRNA(Ile)-lysidine synthase
MPFQGCYIHLVLPLIKAVLEEFQVPDPNQLTVVGVSGGPDSLALMDILHQLGYPVCVAHFDHHLRSGSSSDAAFVAAQARERALDFALGEEEVGAYARRNHQSTEEAARFLRYRFLFETAQRKGAQAVAVAHTADDQVETVLMHFLRGAGSAGLKGMRFCSILPEWDPGIPLVRPLLGTWRSQVMAYCQDRKLLPVTDPTNLDTTYYRNRLRHDLIPYLETYNPRIREIIFRMARVMQGEHELIERSLEVAWQACRKEASAEVVVLDRGCFLNYPLGLQRGMIRTAIAHLVPALRDIDFGDVERAVDFAVDPPFTRSIDLVANLDLTLENGELILGRHSAALPERGWPQWTGEPATLNPPGELPVGENWMLQGSIQEVSGPAAKRRCRELDSYETWLDAASLTLPLEVRTRQPGDRFQPLGLDGHSLKLADFMVNVKLPRRARERWPLVASGGKIAWVPGFRPAHPCRVTGDTRRVVQLKLLKANP